MPDIVGYKGDEEHDLLVAELDEQIRFLSERLRPIVARALRHKALYLRANRRFASRGNNSRNLMPGQDSGRGTGKKEGMQYQSTAVVPLAFRTVETKAAAFSDLLFSADPLIEADALFDREYGGGSRYITKLFDQVAEGNRLRSTLPAVLRDTFADGIKWLRPVWRRMARTVWVQSSQGDVSRWNDAVAMASAKIAQGGDAVPLQPELPVADDPEAWQNWVGLAREVGHKIPDLPVTGRKRIVTYEGPWIVRPGLGEVLYDPECEFEDQELLVYSMEISERELLSLSDDGEGDAADPGKPFVRKQVEEALSGVGIANSDVHRRLSQAKKDYNTMLGLDDSQPQKDQLFGPKHLLEFCYRPMNGDTPYVVLLNRATIINKDVTQFEYEHGQAPLIPLRHLRLDGNMVGVSAIHQGEPLMKEADRVLAYTLDALLFSVLPVFTKLKNSPLPEGLQRLTAGTLIPVDNHDVMKQLTKTAPDMAGAISMIQFFMSLIDDTESTPPSLRGAASTVGRVSASEEVGRKTQALSRIKLLAYGIEDDLQPLIQQSIGLYYQFFESTQREFVAGDGDPIEGMDKALLQAALQSRFRFRGASRAVNRSELVQQLFTFGDKFAAVMNPSEVRKFALRVADEMGLMKKGEFMTDEQTKLLELQSQAQIMQQTAQAQAIISPAPAPIDQIDPATGQPTASAMQPAAPPAAPGGAPQPPPQPPGNGAPPPAAPEAAPAGPAVMQ